MTCSDFFVCWTSGLDKTAALSRNKKSDPMYFFLSCSLLLTELDQKKGKIASFSAFFSSKKHRPKEILFKSSKKKIRSSDQLARKNSHGHKKSNRSFNPFIQSVHHILLFLMKHHFSTKLSRKTSKNNHFLKNFKK